MVYLVPPVSQGSSSSHPTYTTAYNQILRSHRRHAASAASSVIILVAPDVDALCAARMLAALFRDDDVMYQIKPVSGITELELVRNDLMTYTELHTLILLNMGSILDLPSSEWFGDFDLKVTVHVIDPTRPQNLSSLFGGGENGDRIVIWDDGGVAKLENERRAWEALTYEPEPDSDEDEDVISDDEDHLSSGDDDYDQTPGKRRSIGEGNKRGKRRRIDDPDRPKRMTRDEQQTYAVRLEKHYMAGTWYGRSSSATIYSLATALERVDNDLLWFAILGLTHQYTTSRISRRQYDDQHAAFNDEVCRLNSAVSSGVPSSAASLVSATADDTGLRVTEEFRFMLFRHWTLYDAMFHSSYVASKLGIWKEKGRKRLTGLLAKMGFSIPQTQQSYAHMDMDLKKTLHARLQDTAPEYGLVELTYPSFARCFGYMAPPMAAADAVEAIGGLLDVAGGARMEVEIEGGRHGGEWFGGSRTWDGVHTLLAERRDKDGRKKGINDRENIPPSGTALAPIGSKGKSDTTGVHEEREGCAEIDWWIKNFWVAYDALGNISLLKEALPLAMGLHKAIIRTGTSIIDKQDIRTMRHHHVVVLSQGPDLALFAHPGVLARLALWLVEALRERLEPSTAKQRAGLGGGKKKSLPFVVACLNEPNDTYVVVGVMAAMEFGDVRKNEFGLAFLDAKEKCNARTRHGSFETSVLEINQADLKIFLETLCNDVD